MNPQTVRNRTMTANNVTAAIMRWPGLYETEAGRLFQGMPISEVPKQLRVCGWRNVSHMGEFEFLKLGLQIVRTRYVGVRPKRFCDVIVAKWKDEPCLSGLDTQLLEVDMLGPTDTQIVGKWWNMAKRGERFTIGEQPCRHFLRGDADIAALGPGNRRNLHECPKCYGNRAWCDACHTDHHDGGWETCKPGAYADPPDDD